MPLGDSLTEGGYVAKDGSYGVGEGYRTELARLLKQAGQRFVFVGSVRSGSWFTSKTRHEGHTGWHIRGISSKVNEWIESAKPNVILLMIGSSDMLHHADPATSAKELFSLVDQIHSQAHQTKLFLSSLILTNDPALNLKITDFNQRIRGSNAIFVDMERLANLGSSKDDLTDVVHPTSTGYDKMGRVWFEAIRAHFP